MKNKSNKYQQTELGTLLNLSNNKKKKGIIWLVVLSVIFTATILVVSLC